MYPAASETADHMFAQHRAQLVEVITSWLDQRAKGKP
jgi:hypothetical protein